MKNEMKIKVLKDEWVAKDGVILTTIKSKAPALIMGMTFSNQEVAEHIVKVHNESLQHHTPTTEDNKAVQADKIKRIIEADERDGLYEDEPQKTGEYREQFLKDLTRKGFHGVEEFNLDTTPFDVLDWIDEHLTQHPTEQPKQSAKEYIESRKKEFNVNHIINRLEPASLEALFYIMEQYINNDNIK